MKQWILISYSDSLQICIFKIVNNVKILMKEKQYPNFANNITFVIFHLRNNNEETL